MALAPLASNPTSAPSPAPLAQGWRWSDLRFLVAWLLPLSTLAGALGRPQTAALSTLVFWWGIALIDQCWPGAQRSPAARTHHAAFTWLLRGYLPIQAAMLAASVWAASGLGPFGALSWPVVLGLAFAAGFVSGSQGITYAHELGHSRSRADRFCAWVLMTSVSYAHFMVEHYRGHHPRAATWDDPATARRGEGFWRFLPRTLWGSFAHAWVLERQQLAQLKRLRGQSESVGLAWLRSPLVWASGVQVALPLALWALFGLKAAVFWLAQGVVAFVLLELVNYIEHYGLQRRVKVTDSGTEREPFGPNHAWNADHVVTNSLLANLQRHSDHHTQAWKPYAELAPAPQAPQLPTGYAGAIVLALVPPLWFAVMHPKLDRLN